MKKNKHIIVFLSVAFSFSYLLWSIALLLPPGHSTRLYAFLSFTAMMGPFLGTVVVKLLGWKKEEPEIRSSLGRRIRFALLGIVSLYIVLWISQFFLWMGLHHWLTNMPFHVDSSKLGQLFIRSLILPVFWTFAVFLEEYGWRYFLFQEVKKLGAGWASWGVGFIWALWHFPAAFVNGGKNGWLIFLGYLVYVPVLHQFIAYFYEKTRTLVIPVILHAIFNGFGMAQYLTTRLQGNIKQMTSQEVLTLMSPANMTWQEQLVNLGINLGTFILLFVFSVILIRELRRQASFTTLGPKKKQ